MESPKHFGALLTSVVGSLFEKDAGKGEVVLEPASVHAEIYADTAVTVETVGALLLVVRKILKQAAYEDLELDAFETLVQTVGKGTLTPTLQDLFVKFWKTQKPKIHDQVYKKVTWNNSLQRLTWRIDVKTKTKTVSELNEPTAIVELSIQPNKSTSPASASSSTSQSKLVRFEMDKDQLTQALRDINNIQQQLVARTS